MTRRSFFRSLSSAVAGCYIGVGIQLKESVASSLKPEMEFRMIDFTVNGRAYKALQSRIMPARIEPEMFYHNYCV